MTRRAVTAAVALGAVTSLAMLAVACGSSANISTDPIATADAAAANSESGPAPTSANELVPGEGPPNGAPEGRTGAPGLGRGTRFVPLDNPDFVSASEATFLTPDDRVLGLTVNGESRAYPLSMMTFHHVANDEVGGLPVLVTF